MGLEFIGFIVFAISQVGTPGPANIALLAMGAAHGFKKSIPFVIGVAFGKQIIIWPIGFGLMTIAEISPFSFNILKIISIFYIVWLAYKIANLSLRNNKPRNQHPNFFTGLILHPLNPKAWAMIVTAFSTFVNPETSTLEATSLIAIGFLSCQLILHPIWCFGGEKLISIVSKRNQEKYVMLFLAFMAIISIFFIIYP